MDLFDATRSLFRKIQIELEVGFLDSSTSTRTRVLRDFLNVTSIPYRKIRIGLDFGPHRGSKISLGILRWPKLAKEVAQGSPWNTTNVSKVMVFDVSHFSDFIVFSGFAWEGVLILDICNIRVFAKTSFLIERSYQKSMFGRELPHFM